MIYAHCKNFYSFRGRGLAYHPSASHSVRSGYITMQLSRTDHLLDSYHIARELLLNYTKPLGEAPWIQVNIF